MSNLPDNFSPAAYDAAQGRDDTPEEGPETVYDAARDLLWAVDRGLPVGHPGSSYITALREAVAREKAQRDADEGALRSARDQMRILGGRMG